MIVDYIKFKKLPLSSEMALFFIHGNPRNISNELEHDILRFYKKIDYKQQTYVIDDDSQTDFIKNSYFGPYLVTIYVNLKAFWRVLTFLLKNNELINVKKSKQK